MFAQLRGKRIGMGVPGTALRSLMLDVLKATDALDASIQLINLDYATSIDALISGSVDVAIVPAMENGERTITASGIRLMSVAQAEAIAKTVPGLKHLVLWRGLIDLTRDIPSSDVDLLALRNRLLVRKQLHPALQYLLLQAMREVHSAPPDVMIAVDLIDAAVYLHHEVLTVDGPPVLFSFPGSHGRLGTSVEILQSNQRILQTILYVAETVNEPSKSRLFAESPSARPSRRKRFLTRKASSTTGFGDSSSISPAYAPALESSAPFLD